MESPAPSLSPPPPRLRPVLRGLRREVAPDAGVLVLAGALNIIILILLLLLLLLIINIQIIICYYNVY